MSKKETLDQFNALEGLIATETKDIAMKLISEHETFEEAITTLSDYYESDYKLDDFVYSEIYQIMQRRSTGER